MAKKVAKKTKKPFAWHYVYRGTNSTKKEIYHGKGISIETRVNGSHCVGGTKALAHWDCDNDKITWEQVSKHKTESKASSISHGLEKTYVKNGYTNIQTRGK